MPVGDSFTIANVVFVLRMLYSYCECCIHIANVVFILRMLCSYCECCVHIANVVKLTNIIMTLYVAYYSCNCALVQNR